jgi:RNA polymerase sigma-70 factor (ECF subfamily)
MVPTQTRQAFEAMLLDEMPALWRFARRLERDRVRAEDLLQQAIVKALARSHQLQDPGAFRTWMMRVIHNTFLNQRARKEARTPHTSLDNVLALPSSRRGPEHRADATLLGDRIAAAVERLPRHQREVLQLVDGEGMSYEEASAILGIPKGTAASRVARARATLRSRLRDVARERGVVG